MYHYQMEGEFYVLTDDESGDYIGPPLEELAIVIDASSEMFTLHKHGSPELVEKWYKKAQAKYEAADIQDMFATTIYVQGKFNLEELNKLINNSGYGERFMAFHGIELPVIERPVIESDETDGEGEEPIESFHPFRPA